MSSTTSTTSTTPSPATSSFASAAMTRAMALNVTDWTDASVCCLGIKTHATPSLWWRHPGGSGIYLSASILDAATPDAQLFAELRQVLNVWGADTVSLYDNWATRDLRPLGLTKAWQTSWYLRPPDYSDDPPRTLPPGLSIEVVETKEQLAAFEEATRLGFEDPSPYEPFSQHAAGTLDVPGMIYLNARLTDDKRDGKVVSSVIAHVTDNGTDSMVGIYGLSTLPAYRRRGYARALVRAVVDLRPSLPVSVYPDPESLELYASMGFAPGGDIAFWQSNKVT